MPVTRKYNSSRVVKFKYIFVPATNTFVSGSIKAPSSTDVDTNVILLGRYGDILNILPLVKELGATLWVGKSFSDVAQWSKSLKVRVTSFDPEHLTEARREIRREVGEQPVLCAQVYRQVDAQASQNAGVYSFCEESYRLCGELYHQRFLEGYYESFTDFDEAPVPNHVASKIPSEPYLLIHGEGYSSPLKFDLIKWAERELPGLPVVNAAQFKFSRFIDLLWLIRRAKCCVVVDSGPLHLIGLTTDVPYFAFVNDRNNFWYSAYTRGNCHARIPYSTFPAWLTYLRHAVESQFLTKRKVAVVTPGHDTRDIATRIRMRPAVISQRFIADLIGGDRLHWKPTRFLQDNPTRQLPYVKDLFDWALLELKYDWVLYLNDDIIALPELAYSLLTLMKQKRPAMLARMTRTQHAPFREPLLNLYGENVALDGGSDGVWMSKAAWTQIRQRFPDMVVGAHLWDNIMILEIQHVGGTMLYNGLLHSLHGSFWYQGQNRRTLPSQIHNTKLAHEYASKYPWATFLKPYIDVWFNV